MKKVILSLLALPLLLACSSEENEAVAGADRVPLQIELDEITRAVVENVDQLKERSLGVFVATQSNYPYGSVLEEEDNNGNNRQLSYQNGKWNFDRNVYIPENTPLYVWAYYPYDPNQNKNMLADGWALTASKQEDYLASYTDGYTYVTARETSPRVKFNMRHLMARIRVIVAKASDNEKNYAFKEATLYGSSMDARYNPVSGILTPGKETGSIAAYVANGNTMVDADHSVEFEFLVFPKYLSLYVELPNSSLTNNKKALNARTYEAGKQYSVTLTINHLGELEAGEWSIEPWGTSVQNAIEVWKDSKTDEGEVTPTPTPTEEHEYVDLGLPSGTLWATCNIGAEHFWDVGNRYAWGETEVKAYYNDSNYKWLNDNITKYNSLEGHGTVDFLTELEIEDDAAHVNWGGDWRMPTIENVDELVKYCTKEMTSFEGVDGLKIIGPNGKSIFLPAEPTKKFAYYWTSSKESTSSLYALIIYFTEQSLLDHSGVSTGRTMGLFVRPVIRGNILGN